MSLKFYILSSLEIGAGMKIPESQQVQDGEGKTLLAPPCFHD
jgi:hypothetical protein